MELNQNTINLLFQTYSDDDDVYDILCEALKSFYGYHTAIYLMEISKMSRPLKDEDPEKYRQTIQELDHSRTACHNAVLANINILNRLAENSNLPPVFNGVVCEEHPYRKIVADAVLGYVHNIILSREQVYFETYASPKKQSFLASNKNLPGFSRKDIFASNP